MGRFTFIDLFAGIGGFKIGLSNNGGKCIGFSEISKDAIKCYCSNFGISEDKNFGSIKEINSLPKHDLLTAGVPCQSWSIAGRNLGFDDDRGQLWNDTIFLLKESKPKAFIFENVKGLVDPRNKEALSYIMERIKKAGYHAKYYVLNSYDYGVPQNRVRIYIIGFRNKSYFNKFEIPAPLNNKSNLSNILGIRNIKTKKSTQKDLFGNSIKPPKMSLSTTNGFNDYFLFNDLRNGATTIHSWDILDTTQHQKEICLLILKNRRKSKYGKLDGNALSLKHLKELDSSIGIKEVKGLISLGILKSIQYTFEICDFDEKELNANQLMVLNTASSNVISIDELKLNKELKKARISFSKVIAELVQKNILKCIEERFDFKNTKISSGLFGINRIFLPTSDVFSTLVASDTNDYITTRSIECNNVDQFRTDFIEKVYNKKDYRKITKKEACLIQGFPENFELPESRKRWMKLIGNSVSVPVIDMLCKAIVKTKVFD